VVVYFTDADSGYSWISGFVRAAIFRVPPDGEVGEQDADSAGEQERQAVRKPSVRDRLPYCPLIPTHLRHPDVGFGGAQRLHSGGAVALVSGSRDAGQVHPRDDGVAAGT